MNKSDRWVVGSIYILLITLYILFGTYKEMQQLKIQVAEQQVKIVELEDSYENALGMVDSMNVYADELEYRLSKVTNLEQFLKELARIWDER